MGSFIYTTSLLTLGASVLAIPAEKKLPAIDHLKRDAGILQDFAKKVTVDPHGIAATWHGSDVCSYAGVKCSQHPDGYTAVSGLDINGAELGAALPLDGLINKLTDLTFFHANSNQFVGTIPKVSKSKYLYELDISNNNLSGPFPLSTLEAPGKLTYLDLRFNQFSGPLPPALFQTTDMDLIWLNNNNFEGHLPEFGKIATLYITLANNHFTGPIPASISKVEGLVEITFSGNMFTGRVPEGLCALPNVTLIDVSDNPKLDLTFGPECQAQKASGVLVY